MPGTSWPPCLRGSRRRVSGRDHLGHGSTERCGPRAHLQGLAESFYGPLKNRTIGPLAQGVLLQKYPESRLFDVVIGCQGVEQPALAARVVP